MLTRRALLAAPAILRAQSARRPNILFCISDDQSWIHTSAHGSRFVRTPAFDRVASEGALLTHTFVSVPSCAPSRGSVLTGQDFYRLGPASMNHTEWKRGLTTYADALASSGYHAGFTGKGWAPGNWKIAGREHTPCGREYNQLRAKPPGAGVSDIDYTANLEAFLKAKNKETPFCFWAGFLEPHRVFEDGIGVRNGKRLDDIDVPAFLPDTAAVRSDLADYTFEIEYFDRHLARMIDLLEKSGELENTVIVVTADNGMAFPRAKGNLYDYGTRMPCAIRWGSGIKARRTLDGFVSFTDFAPTFLDAAGLALPATMTGVSLLPYLRGARRSQRDFAVLGIERHFPGSRPDGAGYPSRAIRTRDHLYIRNLTPGRNPAGDRPGPVWPDDDPVGGFGDTDGGPSKTRLWNHREEHRRLFDLAFGKRPAEELYEVRRDPFQLRNVAAAQPKACAGLSAKLDEHCKRTADPRATGNAEEIESIMRKYPSISGATSRREALRP